ncbi:MAG: ribosome biogenesis GTP-binding protein YihA/YsxC [Desulfovibrionaceae bacterium]|nr:ribosome biogenesis GTP-binding protein YihA/YsxC [Desulfovibrionaceae bacterium]
MPAKTPELTLESTAYTIEQLLALNDSQIALAGRSNVGKSSLINALAGRKKLAKVSATPGKTRSVNFYRVSPLGFYLVDLPGYGYARASHEERRKWAKVLEHYLTRSKQLKALALLLDCRLSPQKLDLELASFAASCQIPVIPVLTKADKCNQRERMARQKEWQNIIGTKPVLTSSTSRLGLPELWQVLSLAANTARDDDGDEEIPSPVSQVTVAQSE